MIKKYKWTLIISSIVILLPMLLGFFGGNLLPEEIAIHWGFNGQADGYSNSSQIFIIIPLIMLAVHWLCVIMTMVFDKRNHDNSKIMNLVFWIIPAISLASCGMIFTFALGFEDNAHVIIYILFAAMFIFIGNYLPKTRRNVTMGIKLKWAMANDDNWQATHRLAGKCYVAAGLACLVAIPFPMTAGLIIMLGAILIATIVPIIYSYSFYKKQLRNGTATKKDYENGIRDIMPNRKSVIIVSTVLLVAIAIFVAIIMFTGKLEITAGDTALNIDATYTKDTTINYDDIDSVEYRENGVNGVKINGFNSTRFLLGVFKNEELGVYTRYTYTGKKPAIVIKSADKIIVIGTETQQETYALYETILLKISE